MKNFVQKMLPLALAQILVTASPLATAQLAEGQGKFLGNISQNSVPSSFGSYWNQLTPENGGKWGVVESSRDSMNWSGLDAAYQYAQSNGIPFKQHTLVWGNQEPGWIGGLTQQEQLAEITEWIQLAGERYPDSDLWDVVNEPLHDPPTYAAALGGSGQTGWDWVIKSFELAREHVSGQLLINEYGIINDGNLTGEYLEIIQLLQSRGLIDGIGVQAHTFNVVPASPDLIRQNLDRLAATGLPIYVSELDINNADDQAQLQQYQQKFPVLWEHPGVAGKQCRLQRHVAAGAERGIRHAGRAGQCGHAQLCGCAVKPASQPLSHKWERARGEGQEAFRRSSRPGFLTKIRSEAVPECVMAGFHDRGARRRTRSTSSTPTE